MGKTAKPCVKAPTTRAPGRRTFYAKCKCIQKRSGYKIQMGKSSLFPATILACAASLFIAPLAVIAQQCNLAGAPAFGLRTPLVNGTSFGYPFVSVPSDAPPAPGDGACPAPVHAGMTGPPTLIPSNPDYPTDHLGTPTYTLPHNPASTHMPGQYGPSLVGVPPPPSTPGCDPGMVFSKPDYYAPPVAVTNIYPGGGIPDVAPTQRWGGQTSTDFGRYKYRGSRSYDWGQGARWGQFSTDGPYQGLPGAVPTQDIYGMRGCTQAGGTTFTYAPY